MNYTDYIALNDYTDSKGYELIIRVFKDNFSFGWYKDSITKKTISDSQFDTGTINYENAEDEIEDKFGCYYISAR